MITHITKILTQNSVTQIIFFMPQTIATAVKNSKKLVAFNPETGYAEPVADISDNGTPTVV